MAHTHLKQCHGFNRKERIHRPRGLRILINAQTSMSESVSSDFE